MATIRSQLPPAPPSDESEQFSITVRIPDLKIQKTFQQNLTDTIWSLKQQILNTIATKLEDGLNYGVYCPPSNGKAGKFLEEERCWKEYSPKDRKELEVVYKRRIYKDIVFNVRKLREVNSKSGQKKFLNYVKTGNVEKVSKLLGKGLDPNFFDKESGETPFTLAVASKQKVDVLTTLVDGGAHLDFRTKAGHTPLHRAAQTGNKQAIQTLLSFGASPNYKDVKGLTPLYLCVSNDTPADCSELLLREYALHGVTDETGWTEMHQACKFGYVQHLQHLIFYGANMNIKNSSGNTPLHICAILKQEECARLLLFRGADSALTNFANQDPATAAIVTGNQAMAHLIQSFKPEDVVRIQEVPQYNPKRRTIVWQAQQSTLLRQRKFSHSTPHLNQLDQVHIRPGLPWMEKHMAAVETGADGSGISYDSDTPSSIFSEISDPAEGDETNEASGAIYATVGPKKRWQNYQLSIPTHGSLDALQPRSRDGTDSDYQSIRSVSPYSHLYRKKMEDEELKTASIRSYPKRLTPSIFQEDIFRDALRPVEIKPASSPSSPVSKSKNLSSNTFFPTGDFFHENTFSTFSAVEKSGSSPNLLSDNRSNTRAGKTNLLLSPPPGVLQKRQFGSSNDLLLPENEVRSLGRDRSVDVTNIRKSASPGHQGHQGHQGHRGHGSADELLDKGLQVTTLPKGGKSLTREFFFPSSDNSKRTDDPTVGNPIHFKTKEVKTGTVLKAEIHQQPHGGGQYGNAESVRSYRSMEDLDSSSLRSLPLPGREESDRGFPRNISTVKGKQFGSMDDLLNSDQTGNRNGRTGAELRVGKKIPPPPPPIRKSQELNKNLVSVEMTSRGQENSSDQSQRNHTEQSRDSMLILPPPPVFDDDHVMDVTVDLPPPPVFDQPCSSSSPSQSNGSTESKASHGSMDLQSTLIAAVLKRRQMAEAVNRTEMENQEKRSQETERSLRSLGLSEKQSVASASKFPGSQIESTAASKHLKSDSAAANTAGDLTHKATTPGQQNTRSGQLPVASGPGAASTDFLTQAQEMLSTLQRRTHSKNPQQNDTTTTSDVQPIPPAEPPTSGGTPPPPPPPPPPPSSITPYRMQGKPGESREQAPPAVEVTGSTTAAKVKPPPPTQTGGLSGLAEIVAKKALERQRKGTEENSST